MFLRKIFVVIFLFVSFLTFSAEFGDTTADLTVDELNVSDERLSLNIQRRFSNKSTLDVKDFYFYLGKKEITFSEFKSLTNDPLIAKTDKMLKNIIITGSVVGSMFGLTLIGSVIPAGVLVNGAIAGNMVDDSYLFSGIAMFAVAAVSVLGIVIDLIVATTLYHKYRYNEAIIKQIIDNYNKKIGSSKVAPDISYNSQSRFGLNLRIKI